MNELVFTFGRFNPPTKGHIQHFNAMLAYAKRRGCDCVVFVSKTQDTKSNPLSPDVKIEYIKSVIPDIVIKVGSNPFIVIDDVLKDKHYSQLYYFTGSDYFEDEKERTMFERMFKYGKEKNTFIQAVSSGIRTEGVSGSQLRKYAQLKKFEEFLKNSPESIDRKRAEYIFNLIRETQNNAIHTT